RRVMPRRRRGPYRPECRRIPSPDEARSGRGDVMTITASRAGRSRRAVFILTVAVVSAIPVTAGALRLMQLAGGPDLIPADQRISEAPAPVIIHIVGSAVYLLLGALQFVPALRRRPARWHRRAGRVVLLAGI